jgi:hypothetical protein
MTATGVTRNINRQRVGSKLLYFRTRSLMRNTNRRHNLVATHGGKSRRPPLPEAPSPPQSVVSDGEPWYASILIVFGKQPRKYEKSACDRCREKKIRCDLFEGQVRGDDICV